MKNHNGAGFPLIHIKCPWNNSEDMHVAYSVYQVEIFESDTTDIEVTAQYVYYNAADVAAILSESQIYAIEVAIYRLLKETNNEFITRFYTRSIAQH